MGTTKTIAAPSKVEGLKKPEGIAALLAEIAAAPATRPATAQFGPVLSPAQTAALEWLRKTATRKTESSRMPWNKYLMGKDYGNGPAFSAARQIKPQGAYPYKKDGELKAVFGMLAAAKLKRDGRAFIGDLMIVAAVLECGINGQTIMADIVRNTVLGHELRWSAEYDLELNPDPTHAIPDWEGWQVYAEQYDAIIAANQ